LSISSSFNCAMKGYTILSQYHWELRVSKKKKKWVRLCAYATFQSKHPSSHHAVTTHGMHGDCVYTRHISFECWCTLTNGSMPHLWRMWCPKCPLLHGQDSLETTCSTLLT
jgi:hypothetical protein